MGKTIMLAAFLAAVAVTQITAAQPSAPERRTYQQMGGPIDTKELTIGDDTAHKITDLYMGVAATDISDAAGRLAWAIEISVEDYPLRCTRGATATPAQGGAGHVYYVGDSFRLATLRQVRELRCINETAGQTTTLQVSPEY